MSVLKVISLLFLSTVMSIESDELVLINVDTSLILNTLLLSTAIIISFFFKPAFSAGLSTEISSIFGHL